jgi:hypothetical protein
MLAGMFGLSRFEWLLVAVALLLCPGFSWGTEPQAAAGEAGSGASAAATAASLFDRLEFNLVGVPSAAPQPSAAAGASTRPPKPE